MNKIGLRKEEKAFERRVPVVPNHVAQLVKDHNIDVIVEPSDQRAFPDSAYTEVGASISSLKGEAPRVILGIKEMPIGFFEKDKVYVFFSHTIKGQKYNMDMLQDLMDSEGTLIDYERVTDEKGNRLIYFGNWAGMAGISDTLRVLGKLLEKKNISPNPFLGMKTTLDCNGLEELRKVFEGVAQRIKREGLPHSLTPFVVGFAGYGNVSRGAQEMFDILPHKTVNPADLPALEPRDDIIYKCVFKEEDMVEPRNPDDQFELQDYYKHGSAKYRGRFYQYAPYLTVLMNCIYWTKKYPRLLTREHIHEIWQRSDSRLLVVGDISCDIRGAIEFTIRTTKPDKPAFTYLIAEDEAKFEITEEGPIVMAIDNLPCELPRESSTSFSETLLQFVPALAKADFTVDFEELKLPDELKRAVIVYRGRLTEDYEYLQQYLQK
ncbi:hypothetical protein EU519_00255 [Candidatus Thorarchaeota archaeon]|nr:MAG: hypothetical protein EU519_00255 [Candidatus Thorarchaeota archaeon]